MTAAESSLERFRSMLLSFDPIVTITHLALDFWGTPKEGEVEDPLVSQAALEYAAGLLSRSPERSHSKKIPRQTDVMALKKLFQDARLEAFNKSIGELLSLKNEDIGKAILSHTTQDYYLMVRGESYPHRLWTLFEEKYSIHDDFLKEHLGLTAKQISEVFQHIFSIVSKSVNDYASEFREIMREPLQLREKWKEGSISTEQMLSSVDQLKKTLDDKLESHESAISSVLMIQISTLENTFGKTIIAAFLSRFAAEFGELNSKFELPTDFNELNAKPLIFKGDSIFVPVPQLLYQAPIRTLYFDLIRDPEYALTFEKLLGKFQETKTGDSLARIFDRRNIYHGLKYGNQKQFEADLLVIFDDRLLVVESKTKPITAMAALGSYKQIASDFSAAIQTAYDQGIRTKKFIEGSEEAKFYTEQGKELVLKRDDFVAIYVICITSETYATMTADLPELLRKDKDQPFPWVASIPDLDVACDFIPNPYMFIHFLERRLPCYGKVISGDELDYVSNYLTQGLFFNEELKKANAVILSGFAEKFDRDYLIRSGAKYDDAPLVPPDKPEFIHLLQTIQTLDGHGHASMIICLLELGTEAREQLVEVIRQVTNSTLADGKNHDFTLGYPDFGISFVSTRSRDGLRERVVGEGTLKKYKYKKKIWLSLGRAIEDSRFLVNEFCYLNFDWKYDSKLEKLSKQLKGRATTR